MGKQKQVVNTTLTVSSLVKRFLLTASQALADLNTQQGAALSLTWGLCSPQSERKPDIDSALATVLISDQLPREISGCYDAKRSHQHVHQLRLSAIRCGAGLHWDFIHWKKPAATENRNIESVFYFIFLVTYIPWSIICDINRSRHFMISCHVFLLTGRDPVTEMTRTFKSDPNAPNICVIFLDMCQTKYFSCLNSLSVSFRSNLTDLVYFQFNDRTLTV